MVILSVAPEMLYTLPLVRDAGSPILGKPEIHYYLGLQFTGNKLSWNHITHQYKLMYISVFAVKTNTLYFLSFVQEGMILIYDGDMKNTLLINSGQNLTASYTTIAHSCCPRKEKISILVLWQRLLCNIHCTRADVFHIRRRYHKFSYKFDKGLFIKNPENVHRLFYVYLISSRLIECKC